MRQLGNEVARLQEILLDEEYAVQGGRLRIGSKRLLETGVDSRVHLGVWESQHSSIVASFYGLSVQPVDVIAVFNRFTITERGTSVTLIPRDPMQTAFEDAPELAKMLPGVGLVIVRKLSPRQAQRLPRWKGTAVRGGELFVGDRGGHHRHLVLVGERTVTTFMPEPDVAIDDVVQRVSELSITWSDP
jgi:hypothetical protein